MPRQNNANVARSRRERRAAAKGQPNPTKAPPPEVIWGHIRRLSAKVDALENALQKFTEVYSTNMQAFSKAFMTTDGHVYVINRLLQDIAVGRAQFSVAYKEHLQLKPTEPFAGEDVFDLAYYFGQFNEMQQRRAEEAQKAAAKEALGSAHKEDEGEEFGGDYGETQNGSEGEAHQGDGEGSAEVDGDGRDEKDPVSKMQEAAAAGTEG